MYGDENLNFAIDCVIQRFEFTFELMWKTLKDYLEITGYNEFDVGPRGILKFAFKNGIIDNEENFSLILNDRNSTTHVYDEKMAESIYLNVKNKYVKEFENVIKYLDKNYKI